MLRVDRSAPAAPSQLRIARNADGTYALSWTNPEPGHRFADRCRAGSGVRRNGMRRDDDPGRSRHQPDRIDRASSGRADDQGLARGRSGSCGTGNAVALTVDPSTVEAPGVLETRPPVLLPSGLAPSPRLRVTKARRSGAILTLSGTIARGATASITRGRFAPKGQAPLVGARTKPKKGRWSLKVRLTPGLRHASTFYVNVTYAGQQSFRKTTLHRRLSKKSPRRGSTATEFSVESRSARRR